MKKDYLPSKKFIYSIGLILGIGLLFLGISILISKKDHFSSSKDSKLETKDISVNDLLQTDTDGDGVADWEEALWGTDPNKTATFGIPDATYIANKKKEMNIADDAGDGSNLTETDKFAREFFATFTAMKQSGGDSTTINSFSNSLGEKISDPTIIDQYSINDAKTDNDNSLNNQQKYYNTVKKLFNSYQAAGLGDELSITANDMTDPSAETKDTEDAQLVSIGNAYKDFAKKMLDITVPEMLIQYHIKIANSANNTGISVANMAKIANDPVVGLSGLSQYQKYSDELVANVNSLEANLSMKEKN